MTRKDDPPPLLVGRITPLSKAADELRDALAVSEKDREVREFKRALLSDKAIERVEEEIRRWQADDPVARLDLSLGEAAVNAAIQGASGQ